MLEGEDPGACWGRGLCQSGIDHSLVFSRIRAVGSETTPSNALNNFITTGDVNTYY